MLKAAELYTFKWLVVQCEFDLKKIKGLQGKIFHPERAVFEGVTDGAIVPQIPIGSQQRGRHQTLPRSLPPFNSQPSGSFVPKFLVQLWRVHVCLSHTYRHYATHLVLFHSKLLFISVTTNRPMNPVYVSQTISTIAHLVAFGHFSLNKLTEFPSKSSAKPYYNLGLAWDILCANNPLPHDTALHWFLVIEVLVTRVIHKASQTSL